MDKSLRERLESSHCHIVRSRVLGLQHLQQVKVTIEVNYNQMILHLINLKYSLSLK